MDLGFELIFKSRDGHSLEARMDKRRREESFLRT